MLRTCAGDLDIALTVVAVVCVAQLHAAAKRCMACYWPKHSSHRALSKQPAVNCLRDLSKQFIHEPTVEALCTAE